MTQKIIIPERVIKEITNKVNARWNVHRAHVYTHMVEEIVADIFGYIGAEVFIERPNDPDPDNDWADGYPGDFGDS